MRPKYIAIILTLLALALPASPAHASGVVSVCDEAHLLAALAGGGTVTFTCSGTITLTAEISFAVDTTIDGSGQAVTVSGNHVVRVFNVNSGVMLNLNELTVAHGGVPGVGYGGGIANWGGTVTVSNSTFTSNSAEKGGGIYNHGGTLTVSNSTFSSNAAEDGGGIYNDGGTVTVSNSTFSSNSSLDFGGGGIHNHSGAVTVSNSTFFANFGSEAGGIYNGYGTVTVSNSTFSGNNGGGLHNLSGILTLKNTIVANSPFGNNCSGVITDGAGNLSYPDTTCPGINGDPVLGPLRNNGGPTETMALGYVSAAIDTANNATCAASPVNNRDQRGIVRPQAFHCDIGAIEEYCPSFVPPATVGVEDIVTIATRWGWTNTTPGWNSTYDLNGDNRIDIVDITLVTRAWGDTCWWPPVSS